MRYLRTDYARIINFPLLGGELKYCLESPDPSTAKISAWYHDGVHFCSTNPAGSTVDVIIKGGNGWKVRTDGYYIRNLYHRIIQEEFDIFAEDRNMIGFLYLRAYPVGPWVRQAWKTDYLKPGGVQAGELYGLIRFRYVLFIPTVK